MHWPAYVSFRWLHHEILETAVRCWHLGVVDDRKFQRFLSRAERVVVKRLARRLAEEREERVKILTARAAREEELFPEAAKTSK